MPRGAAPQRHPSQRCELSRWGGADAGHDRAGIGASRYWSEPTESSATERAGEPLSGTQGRGAHSLTIRRAIASSSSSVRARWRRRISRPRRLAASCTESARARPRPRAHHRCEFKRDETMHVKARKRGGRTLYARMQESLRDWLALGVTKTRVVYGLGKAAPWYHV